MRQNEYLWSKGLLEIMMTMMLYVGGYEIFMDIDFIHFMIPSQITNKQTLN